jgi:hypothetical protein
VGLTVFVGAVFGLLTFPLIAVLFLTDDKPPGHRVRRVIGFAVVAAAVSIMFLPVSAHVNSYEEFAQRGFNRSMQHLAVCLRRRVADRALLPGCAS